MLQTSLLRDGLGSLVTLAGGDLASLWRQVTNAAAAGTALHDILPGIVEAYGAAAATLAVDWYDDQRDKLGIRGTFRAIPADIKDTGTHALIGWALDTATNDDALKALIAGGVQQRIANFSRQTVMGSTIEDPQAHGWQREARGGCAFCQMLAGRGAVYSEASADFASHNDCRCTAVPAFTGQPKPVKAYTPSTRTSSDADRARVRAWLANH